MPGLSAGEGGRAVVPSERREALRVWLRLLASSGSVEREIQMRLREQFGVSLARFDFLAQLDRSDDGEMTMTELSQQLMVSGGNITGLTDRLAKEGLVERRAHPADRRVQRIALTDEGKSLFAEMAREHARWVAEIMGDLENTDIEVLLKALEKIKDSTELAAARRASRDGGTQ